jgi:hypothetical protein
MPPKKSNAAAASKDAPAKKVSKVPSEPKAQAKALPNWAFFTHKSVEFNKLARDLSDRLHDIYGPEVTISQFEKLVAEFPTLSKEQQGLIFLDKRLLDALALYRGAKDAKDTERRSFRSDLPVKDITTGLEACLSIVGKPHLEVPSGFVEGEDEDA